MSTTTIQDQTVREALHEQVRAARTVGDRADMLRLIAANWDNNIYKWDRRIAAGTAYGMSIDEVIDGLTLAASEYAAPGLPRVEIRNYMQELRDRVNALARYETGYGWDGDEDDEKRLYSDETVLTLLNTDIDDALWPLLSGEPSGRVCRWCSRHKPSVTTWNAQDGLSSRCADCKAQGR